MQFESFYIDWKGYCPLSDVWGAVQDYSQISDQAQVRQRLLLLLLESTTLVKLKRLRTENYRPHLIEYYSTSHTAQSR
jgi:hypothetical protein